MSPQRVAMALATLAGSLCVVPAAAQATAGDSIVPHFAWPVGTVARVQYTQVIEREGDGDQPLRIEFEGEYTLYVHEHPSGLLVEYVDPLTTRFRSSPVLSLDDPRRIVYSTRGMVVPDLVISRDGHLLGIEGLAPLAAAIAAAVEQQVPTADVQAIVGEMVSGPQLLRTAREFWNNQVGIWTDAVLRVGEIGGGEAQEANPLIPSLVVPYEYRFALVGMEPCGTSGTNCAQVELASAHDPAELNNAMTVALARVGLENLSFDGLVQESRVSLRTDPKTLLTHEFTMSKRVQGILEDGGQTRVFRRLDETRLVYTYEGN
jgi:hypothetical protein